MKFAVTDFDAIAGVADNIPKHRIVGTRQFREVGPDQVIEKVRPDSVKRFLARIHSYRRFEVLVEITVDEHRQAGNVVEVGVRQKYVANGMQVVNGEITDTGTGIEQHVVVDEHGGSTRSRADSATAAKNPDSHFPVGLMAPSASIGLHHMG